MVRMAAEEARVVLERHGHVHHVGEGGVVWRRGERVGKERRPGRDGVESAAWLPEVLGGGGLVRRNKGPVRRRRLVAAAKHVPLVANVGRGREAAIGRCPRRGGFVVREETWWVAVRV